jgi:AbrB family looped-hinge helix DNA binding protein
VPCRTISRNIEPAAGRAYPLAPCMDEAIVGDAWVDLHPLLGARSFVKLYLYRFSISKMVVTTMRTVTVSSKFQVVIPEEIREKAGIKAKQKVVVLEKGGVIHLIPQRPLDELRGFLKGVRAEELREEEERW